MRAVVVCVALVASVASAAPYADLEQRFRADVERANAQAVAPWDEANAARSSEKLDEAEAAYRKVIELAPQLDHGHRRLCWLLDRRGRIDEALVECERALELAPSSPFDKSALAETLLQRGGVEDRLRALPYARDSSAEVPDHEGMATVWCMAAAANENKADLEWCVERLLKIAPNGVATNIYGAILANVDGDYATARAYLDKAKAAGLDDATYRAIAADIDKADRASPGLPDDVWLVITIGLWVVGIWLGVMIVLLAAGYALSRATLARASTATVETGAHGLRRLYKAVLVLSGIYFYLSMPILLVIVIGAGCAVFATMWAAGFIAVKLIAVVGIVVFATVAAILRSLFVRPKPPPPPGDELDLAKYPQLRALLEDVARSIGTRPVDLVYLTPGTEMGVTERAGLWSTLRHKTARRALIMGIALFDDMTQLQLRSILAHEHGHFRNEDTAGGGFALAVRRSLYTLILGMAHSGVAGAFNPVWWFLRGFHRVYLGISQGASRLQEVLADRWAIQAFGSAAFVAAYEHTVARSVAFDHDVDATVKKVRSEQGVLANLYSFAAPTEASAIEADVKSEMAREPSAYDSHPSPNQRIAWAKQLAVPRTPAPDDEAPVWALFPDREDIERAMTNVVRRSLLANYGIKLRATDADPVETDEGKWSGYGNDDDSKNTA